MDKRCALAMSVVLLLGRPELATAEGERELLDVLPESTLLYAHLDLAKIIEEGPQLRLISMVRSDEVTRFIAPLWKKLLAAFHTRAEEAGIDLERHSMDDLDLDIELALLGLGPGVIRGEGGPVSFAVSVRSPDPEKTATLLAELFGKYLRVDEEEYEGVLLRRVSSLSGTELFSVAAFEDRVLSAENSRRVLELRDMLWDPTPGPRRLTGEAEFTRWRSLIDERSAVLEVFAALPRFLPSLELAPFEAARIARDLGVLRLRGLGVAWSFVGGDIRESIALLLPEERTGLLRLFDVLEPDPTLAEELDSGADLVIAAHVDVGKVLEVIEDSLEDAGLGFGDVSEGGDSESSPRRAWDLAKEIVAALGNRVTVHLELPDTVSYPEVLVRLPVRDRERLTAAAWSASEVIFGRSSRALLDEVTEEESLRRDSSVKTAPTESMTVFQSDSVKINLIRMPDGTGLVVVEFRVDSMNDVPPPTPSMAIHDGALWCSETPASAKSFLYRAKRGEPLFSLARHNMAERNLWWSKAPPEDFVLLIAADVASIARKILPFLNAMAPAILRGLEKGGVSLRAGDIPRLEILVDGFSPYLARLSKRHNSLLWEEQSATGGIHLSYWFLIGPAGTSFWLLNQQSNYSDAPTQTPAPSAPDYAARPDIGVLLASATEDGFRARFVGRVEPGGAGKGSGLRGTIIIPPATEDGSRVRFVEWVEPGSAGERAGLRVGDELLATDSDPLEDSADLDRCVRSAGVGGTILIRLRRSGVILELPVRVGASVGASVGATTGAEQE